MTSIPQPPALAPLPFVRPRLPTSAAGRHAGPAPCGPTATRIAVLTKTYPKLSETFVLHELLGLEARGLELHIFALRRPSDRVRQRANALVRAPVSYLDLRRDRLSALCRSHLDILRRTPWRWMMTLLFALRHGGVEGLSAFLQGGLLAAELDRLGIGHVHTHFASTPADVAEIAAKLADITYSVSAHAKDIYLSPPEALRRKLGAARFVVTCTAYNQRHLQALLGPKVPVQRLYHGVNAARFQPAWPVVLARPPLILSVGRLRGKKGFSDLIEACARLKAAGVPFRCRIVGYGPDADRLQRLITERGLRDVVRLLGPMAHDRLIRLYRQATVFVLPCRITPDGDRDGIPNVLLEAMAMALPVVSTRISGIPEAVEHGRTGLLVAPAAPDELYRAIRRLLNDPDARQRFGAAARIRVLTKFAPEPGLSSLETLLRRAATVPRSEPQAQPEIGYILKGFPRLSEPFIANEIHLLERLGLRLRLFSVKPGEHEQVHDVVHRIGAPITYLPEVDSVSQTPLFVWLRHNLWKFTAAHRELIRLRPLAYTMTLLFALAMCCKYRKAALARPRKVFIKEFLQAGTIALAVLKAPGIRHLHAHFCHGATTIAWYVSRLTGLPFSFTAHAKDIYQTKLNPKDLLPRKLRAAEFVVTCTGANREHLQRLAPGATIVHQIYHGLDTADFAFRQPAGKIADPLILAVGRLTAKKGFTHLIEACAELRTAGVAFRCRIVGERGDDLVRVRDRMHELGLADRVELMAAVTQERLKEIYREASVFALPCQIVEDGDRDGIPNVLVEAMAMGVPVVSTPVSGIPELIEDGVNGLLVPPGDSAALSAALRRLIEDEGLGQRLSAAARAKVCREFDAWTTTRRLRDLFLATLQPQGMVA